MRNPPLEALLLITGALAALLALGMIVTKLLHHQVTRWRGVRSAHYTAVVGELVSRHIIPPNVPRGWAQDPLFHRALADYRLLLTGSDRDYIDELAATVGVHRYLARRARRGWTRASRLRAIADLVDLAVDCHLELFRSMLRERSPHVRTQAVGGLSRLGDVESIPFILDRTTRMRAWERARAIDALVGMGSPAVDNLTAWIRRHRRAVGQNAEVVALAIRALGLIGDSRAEDVLIDLLQSDITGWRIAAASALERAGGTRSVDALVKALSDPSGEVRARVVVALGATAEPTVTADVAARLSDPVWWVRQNAATALAELPGGLTHLLAAIDGPDPYAADAAHTQLAHSAVTDNDVAPETIRNTTRPNRLAPAQ